MMNQTNITIVGFGWASIGFLQDIDTRKYNVTIISDHDSFVYTPLLAQNVKNNRDITIPLSSLNKRITFNRGLVSNVDFAKQVTNTDSHKSTPYQYIVFAHGSDVNTFGIPGVKENTLCLKTMEDSIQIREHIEQLDHGSTVAVIGCGLAGTELIGTLLDYNRYTVVAVDALERPLSTFSEDISQRVIKLWESEQVRMHFKSLVSKIHANSMDIKNQPTIHFDLAIWCGGIKANQLSHTVNRALQLDCSRGIPVNEQLRVANRTNIFAIGDCAFSGNPPTAQVAYQQGKYLAKQFNSDFQDKNSFVFHDKGQIGYIGKGQSVYQSSTFKGGGNLVYYFNNLVHLYNFGKVYVNSKW